jgi:hypothetical protein
MRRPRPLERTADAVVAMLLRPRTITTTIAKPGMIERHRGWTVSLLFDYLRVAFQSAMILDHHQSAGGTTIAKTETIKENDTDIDDGCVVSFVPKSGIFRIKI